MKSKIMYMVFAIYAVLFFGFNAVRCCVNDQWFIGCIFLFGTMIGIYMACYMKEEYDRAKEEKRKKL